MQGSLHPQQRPLLLYWQAPTCGADARAMDARRACSKGFGPFNDGLRVGEPHTT
jgi:hypothetical protein